MPEPEGGLFPHSARLTLVNPFPRDLGERHSFRQKVVSGPWMPSNGILAGGSG